MPPFMTAFHNMNKNTMTKTPTTNFATPTMRTLLEKHQQHRRPPFQAGQASCKAGSAGRQTWKGARWCGVDRLFLGVWQKRPIHNQYFQSQFGRQTSCCNVFVVDDFKYMEVKATCL